MARGTTLHIELIGVRRFMLRLHIASLLMRVASVIAGCDAVVDLVLAVADRPIGPPPPSKDD